MGVAAYRSAPQLAVGMELPIKIEPSAVPGLGIQRVATTWAGQTEVFDATFLSFFRHIISGEGLRDWGAGVGFLVTAGAVAAHSLEAWCTCMGIMSIGMGLFNMLPIPVLNGGHIFLCLVEIIDRRLVDRLRLPLAYAA